MRPHHLPVRARVQDDPATTDPFLSGQQAAEACDSP